MERLFTMANPYKDVTSNITYSMTQENPFSFSTKLWQRSQNSYATTIPQNILAIKSVPVEEEVEVNWEIDQDSGDVIVSFEEVDDDDE